MKLHCWPQAGVALWLCAAIPLGYNKPAPQTTPDHSREPVERHHPHHNPASSGGRGRGGGASPFRSLLPEDPAQISGDPVYRNFRRRWRQMELQRRKAHEVQNLKLQKRKAHLRQPMAARKWGGEPNTERENKSETHRLNLSGSQHKGYSQHLQNLEQLSRL